MLTRQTTLANTPAQAESQLLWLKPSAGAISLYVNANKAVYTCFKQKASLFHYKRVTCKINEPAPIPRQQHLIN